MAAQHLAAIKIQGSIRRFLHTKHLNEIIQARQQGQPMSMAWLLPPKVRIRLGLVPAKQRGQHQNVSYGGGMVESNSGDQL